MAAPLLALPFITKAGAALSKLGSLLGGGAKAASTAKGIGVMGMPAGVYAPAATTATKAATTAAPAFKSGFGKALFGNMNRGDIIGRLAPDAFFGGMAALQTPGDFGDKLIAGTTSTLGSGLLGLPAGRLAGRFGNTAGFLGDTAGSLLGDYGGAVVGDQLMRGKDKLSGGEGMTPYERLNAQQHAQMIAQIRQQTLNSVGMGPGFQQRYFDNTGMMS